jgi:hypothetical protein
MGKENGSQDRKADVPGAAAGAAANRWDAVIPNPKLKLLDPVREVMRLKHYSTTMI